MIKKSMLLSAVLMSALSLTTSLSASEQSYVYNHEGLFLTANERSAVRVYNCDSGLCGRIEWIIEGGMSHDVKNPDPALRGNPMCGLEIMRGLKQRGENTNIYRNGQIYKADDGEIYDASAEYLSSEKLKVRGYMGISLLGKSQVWTRVSEKDYPKCTPAAPLKVDMQAIKEQAAEKAVEAKPTLNQ